MKRDKNATGHAWIFEKSCLNDTRRIYFPMKTTKCTSKLLVAFSCCPRIFEFSVGIGVFVKVLVRSLSFSLQSLNVAFCGFFFFALWILSAGFTKWTSILKVLQKAIQVPHQPPLIQICNHYFAARFNKEQLELLRPWSCNCVCFIVWCFKLNL